MKQAKRFFVMSLFVVLIGTLAFGSTVAAAEAEQRAEFVNPIMLVNTSFLNIRTGPSAQYTVLVTVVGGTELPVLGVARDLVWYQVSTTVGVGWVNSEFTIPRGNFSDVLFAEAPVPVGLAAPDMVDGQGQGSMGESPRGVTFGGVRDWGVSVKTTHPARSAPTGIANAVGTAVEGDVIYTILEAQANDGMLWYRVNIPGIGSAWLEGEKSQLRPFGCEFSVARLENTVRPGVGPDGTGTLNGELELRAGTEAYLVDSAEDEYKIELIDGNTGWIVFSNASVRRPGSLESEYCSNFVPGTGSMEDGTGSGSMQVDPPNTPRLLLPTVIINTGFLNIRSGPGAQFLPVTTLPGGAELTVIGFAPDGVWYLVEGEFGQGWLNSEFVLFRGNGANVPIVEDFGDVQLARPVAQITNALTLYVAPDTTLGVVGALSGPLELDIVARTDDFDWVQLETDLGFGWVLADQVVLTGDLTLIPVVR